MSNVRNLKTKKSKKRKRYRIKGLYLVILIIGLYFTSRMLPLLSASAQSTYAVEYGKIEKSIESVAYVAREEKVFKIVGSEDIKYFVSEGDKIGKGEKLAEVYLEQLDDRARKDLESINLRLENIKEKENGQGFLKGDIEKIEEQISNLIESIQEDLREERYDRIINFKKELETLLDKKSIIAGEKSFSGKNTTQLEEQKSQLESKVNSSVKTIYSDSPGFVAMGSDGFEGLLNHKSLDEITAKELKLLKDSDLNSSLQDVKEGQSIIRIIESYKWSIIVEIDSDQGKEIEKGKSVKIRTTDNDKELKAIVGNVIEDGDKKIVIFNLDEYIADFYNTRVTTVEIILNQYEGAIISNSSIVERNGITGIYTVDLNGKSNFKPIKVQATNKEYSIIDNGHFKEKSKDDPNKEETIKTINLYDEVVMNANKIKEGKRIK